MNNSLLIDSFLEMMSAERGAAANTLTAYGRDLEEFSDYLQGTKSSLLSAGTEDLRQWLIRLEKEGTSYQRIKDNARRDVAITLLSKEGRTVSDVAEQTGFSDPSAFHRSFKKWTGQSPGSYR